MIRILLVDDQRLMTDGLKTILQARDDCTVAGIAHDGQQALDWLASAPNQAIDLVLLDIRMPGLDGVRAVRLIKQRHPAVKVVMLTTFNDEDYLLDALAGGADGYLLKDMEPAELFTAIDNVLKGQLVMPAQVADKLRSGLAGIKARRAAEKRLQELGFNPREVEIADLLVAGFTNSQIAAALFLTEGTTRNYVSGIYVKLGVNDRVKAILALQAL